MAGVEWSTVIVDGVDICRRWGLIYTDESVRNPPEKRTNYVDVPGMDGTLDLSEVLTDDMVFGRRTEKIVLSVPDGANFEQVKTEVSNFLDGKRFDYSYNFDPGYTLNGRFRVTDYSGWRARRIEIEVDAEPFKRGQHMRYVVRGAGGTTQLLHNGRRHVIPVVTVRGPTLLEYKTRSWELGRDEPGSYIVDALRLDEGDSTIYVNSAPDYCDTTVQDLQDRYGQMSKVADTRISDLFVTKTDPPQGSQYDVVIEYDIQDL